MRKSFPLDLLYLGGAIALIGASLFLILGAEDHGNDSHNSLI